MLTENRKLIVDYIERIWNLNLFDELDKCIHSHFIDHSLPSGFTPDRMGPMNLINTTRFAFEHYSAIEDHVTEGNRSTIKIKMNLKHIGIWRGVDGQALNYLLSATEVF